VTTSGRRPEVSREAADLLAESDVIDAHVESFIWTRILGYDLGVEHGRNLLGNRFLGQADLPRMRAGGLTGAVMSIATNPFRTEAGRGAAVRRNVDRLVRILDDNGVAVVRDAAGYRRARAGGRFAAFVALQGGNALTPDDLDASELDVLSRITLVHLTRSRLGSPSAPTPGGRAGGLTPAGSRLVEAMAARSIVLDLAHAAPATFWDALDAAPRAAPVIVSHTGVWAERPSWRNVDDSQIRAVADRGGVVGIIFHRGFLARPGRRARASDVARHVAHVIRVGGEDAAALGSDFDGMIVPPPDLATAADLPQLVDALLRAGIGPDRTRKVLGANYLRVMAGGAPEPTGAG
jgi:membrane dipeptidase